MLIFKRNLACVSLILGGAALLYPLEDPRAFAQEQANKRPWTVNCSTASTGTLQCQMSQTLLVAKTRQRILRVAITKTQQADQMIMSVSMPHGLYLPGGLTLAVDAAPGKRYDIQTADQNGSYTNLLLDAALLDAFKRGNVMSITLQNANRQPVKMELYLTGFTEMLDTLR